MGGEGEERTTAPLPRPPSVAWKQRSPTIRAGSRSTTFILSSAAIKCLLVQFLRERASRRMRVPEFVIASNPSDVGRVLWLAEHSSEYPPAAPMVCLERRAEWLADVMLGHELFHAIFHGQLSAWWDDGHSGFVRFQQALAGIYLARAPLVAVQVFLGECAPACFPADATFALYGSLTARAAPSLRTPLTLCAARRAFWLAMRTADPKQARIGHVRAWCRGGAGMDERAFRVAFDRALLSARAEYEQGVTMDVANPSRLRAMSKKNKSDEILHCTRITASSILSIVAVTLM